MYMAVFQNSFIYKNRWQAGFYPVPPQFANSWLRTCYERSVSTIKSWHKCKPQKNVTEDDQNRGDSEGVLK